jgi:hypothetical protein
MPRWLPGLNWIAGDFLTEQRLDGQQGNADMLRDEARFRVIAAGELNGYSATSAWWARLRVVVGGNTLATNWEAYSSTGVWTVALPRNMALSGLTNGVAYDADIFVDFDTAPGMGSVVNVQVGRSTFMYAEDIGYLSVFARAIFWSGTHNVDVKDLALVLTREDEGL